MKTRDEIANELYNDCRELVQPPPLLENVKISLLLISTANNRDRSGETPEDAREVWANVIKTYAKGLNNGREAGPELLAAVEARAAEFIETWSGTDPAEIWKESAAEISAILGTEPAPAGAQSMPTGPVLDLMHDFLGSSGDLIEWRDKKAIVSHNGKYEIETNGGAGRRITRRAPNGVFSLEVMDIGKFTGSNQAAEKIFMFTLVEAARQSLHNGELIRDQVHFSLQDLVDSGCYKSIPAARRGFWAGRDALELLRVSGYVMQGKEEKQISLNNAKSRTLFIGGDINNAQCVIYLNPHLDWSVVAPFFSLIPEYYFRLSARGKTLIYYIFYLARQRTREIEEEGKFTISLRAIHERLGLPPETETDHPKRDIVDEIDRVLEEIEEYNKTYYPEKQFNLLVLYDDGGKKRLSISDYLNKGKLQISISGDLAAGFIKLSQSRRKKIETAQKRAARIEEKAAAIKKSKAP